MEGDENKKVFVKWAATDFEDNGSLTTAGTTVNLYYSTDNVNFTPFATGLAPNTSSQSCTTNSSEEILPVGKEWTGCYIWNLPGVLYEKLMFIRVEVIDADSLGASALTPPLNAGNMSILAGDLDKGIGGQARSAMFSMPANASSDRGGNSLPNTFIVDSKGVTYFLEPTTGILKIDPSDGIIKVFMEIDEDEDIPSIQSGPS